MSAQICVSLGDKSRGSSGPSPSANILSFPPINNKEHSSLLLIGEQIRVTYKCNENKSGFLMKSIFMIFSTFLLFFASSGGQTNVIEEVLVTAQKREEGVQEVPLAVSAYTGSYLDDRQITNLVELTKFSPSFRFQQGGTLRNSSVAIRGIGSSGQNAGIDGSVGLYLDGVYIPRQAGLVGSLSDVSTIEILKGPQGTLFGANTPAGLVNVNTADPTQDFEGKVQFGLGNYGEQQASGYISGGLSDDMAARIAFWQKSNDGTTKLKTGGSSNSREEWGFRVKSIWTPSDNTEVEFAADYSDIFANCCVGEWVDISDEALATFDRMATGLLLDRALIFPSRESDGYLGRGEKLDHVSYSQNQALDDIQHMGVSLGVSHGLSTGHELTVVASHRDWDSNQVQDMDSVGLDVSVFPNQFETHKTTSLEINFSSPSGERFEYLLGVFYYEDDGFFWQRSDLVAPGCAFTRNTQGRVDRGALEDTIDDRQQCGGSARSDQWDQTHESLAAYAQFGYDLTEQWSVTFGARITQDEKSVDKRVRLFDPLTESNYTTLGLNCPLCSFAEGNPTANNLGLFFGTQAFQDSIDNSQATFSASTQYKLQDVGASDDVMFYARYATGYKAPGINARPIRFPTIPTNYNEETSTNMEFGVKTTWLDKRLLANATIFQNNFEDLQQIAANPSSDPTGAVGTFVQNAGELDHSGIELEYIFQPTANLSLSGAFTYLDSEYKEFRRSPCPSIGDVPKDADVTTLCDFTGLEKDQTPKIRTNHTIRYSAPSMRKSIDWFVQGSWIYEDEYFLSSDLDARGLVDAFSLFDAAAGLEAVDGRWDLTFYVRNLTDEIYGTGLINGAVPGNFGNRGSKVLRIGEPRTFGVRFTANFE